MWIVSGLEKLTGMTIAFSRIVRTTVAVSTVAFLLASGAAHSTGTSHVEPFGPSSAAEEAFPDAPFGVDPVVTGPSTASFKKRQQAFNCGKAVWPNVPLGCYPTR